MKYGILLAIGVAMLAFGISGLVARAKAIPAERVEQVKVCPKRDFVHEFVVRYQNEKPFSNEERAGYAVGLGLAVLADSMSYCK